MNNPMMHRVGFGISLALCLLLGCQVLEVEQDQPREAQQPETQAVATTETVKHGGLEISEARQEKRKELYLINCSNCHGDDAKGHPEPGHAFPPIPGPLLSLSDKYSQDEVQDIVTNGIPHTGMYAFGEYLSEEEIAEIIDYLWTLDLPSEQKSQTERE